MRLLIAGFVNLLLALGVVLRWPFRMLRVGSRPEWVRIRLAGELPYRRMPRQRLARFARPRRPSSDVPSIHDLRRLLARLGDDDRVRGVLLQVQDLELSPAKRASVAAALEAFRSRGKRVVGWAVSAGNSELEVLVSADEILLPAAGRVELTGFAAEVTALGEGLERLGVRAQFVRRGDYKTAPELFTHQDVSDIQRATVERLLDERFTALVDALSKGRRLAPEQALQRIDGGPYSARRAVQEGLADGLCSEADLPAHLAPPDAKPEKKGERPEARVGSASAYLASLPVAPVRWRPIRRKALVALVPVSGAIMPGEGGPSPMGLRSAGGDALVRALRRLEKARGVDAVVLMIDSPGGSALASELILEAVKRLDRKMPVLAYVDRMCASGGYMVAMGAREFWSAPSAIVGSIGVFAGKFDLSGLMSRLGIRRHVIARGRNAGLHSSARGFTDSERASLELEVEETYQAFLSIVAEGRKRAVGEIHARAEGRIFSGRSAHAEGLVDRLGGFEEACLRALELAGKPGADFDLALLRPTPRAAALRRLLPAIQGTRMWALSWPLFRIAGEPAPRDAW